MSAIAEYQPFRNVHAKNLVQARFEVPVLVSLLRLPREARVLEVGCGRGIALAPLARLCSPTRLVGIDVDAPALRLAASRLAADGVGAELVEADVRSLPFPDCSFDVVLDFGTIYHVLEPERALSEIGRVLRPGGTFVHETRVAQLFAHPIRARRSAVHWGSAPQLRQTRHVVLWSARTRTATFEQSPPVRASAKGARWARRAGSAVAR